MAIEDIEDFWSQHYSDSFAGKFSRFPDSCRSIREVAEPLRRAGKRIRLQRTVLRSPRRDRLGPRQSDARGQGVLRRHGINGLLAHEYGHALQSRAGLVGEQKSSILVREQQADCMAGMYMRWVAEGHSPRFSLNTSRALDQVMAGAIAGRDPVSTFDSIGARTAVARHRTRPGERVPEGIRRRTDGCATMDSAEIQERRGNLPPSLFDPASPQSDIGIDEQTLSTLMELLGQIFAPADLPRLASDGDGCTASEQRPVVYCPDSNTIAVDHADAASDRRPRRRERLVLLQGDNTALSMVTSRYALALQHERGLALNSPVAAMRTACLTGVAQRRMAESDSRAVGQPARPWCRRYRRSGVRSVDQRRGGDRCQRNARAIRLHPDPRVSHRPARRCRRLLSAVCLRESACERTAGSPPPEARGQNRRGAAAFESGPGPGRRRAMVEERQHSGPPAADACSTAEGVATASACAATTRSEAAAAAGPAPGSTDHKPRPGIVTRRRRPAGTAGRSHC